MMAVIRWFTSNPITVNLLLCMILASGVISLPSLKREILPRPSLDRVSVSVSYPDAAPEEVEESLCIPIEEAIDGIDGIRRISSTATEGYAVVTAELGIGTDRSRALDEVKSRVDRLNSLPLGASEPVVQELIDNSVVMGVAVYGDTDERTLRRVAQRIRDAIADLPESSQVELASAPSYEIAIEVSESAMRRYQISFDDVGRAIARASIDLPGGTLKTSSSEIRLRSPGRARTGREFEDIALLSRPDGTRLLVGDVATVVEGFADQDERARFEGQPALLVRILDRDVPDIVALSRAVNDRLDQLRPALPSGVSIAVWADKSTALESRLRLMLRNAAVGFVLVACMLTLFLGLRIGFWVAAGIPVAFLGALAAMATFDVSLNMISLFGFIVALGLVVDDAIVVGEQIAVHGAHTASHVDAAIQGARATVIPVTASVLTTMLFMAPNLALPTTIGKFAAPLGFVVIACLFFSLIECYLILPSHLSHGASSEGRPTSSFVARLSELQGRFVAAFDRESRNVYGRVFDWVVRFRYLTLSLAAVTLMLAVSIVGGGWIEFSLVPHIEADNVSVELAFPDGTPARITDAALRRLERTAFELRASLDHGDASPSTPESFHVLSSMGSPADRYIPPEFHREGGHRGSVRLDLGGGGERRVNSIEIADRWRESVGLVVGVDTLRFSGSEFDGDEASIDLELSAASRIDLERAAAQLTSRIAELPGVRNVSNSMRRGRNELRVRLRAEAEAYGLSHRDLARQVRQGFLGEVVQTLQRGRDTVGVVVRYPESERRSLGDVEDMRIRTASGQAVPFSTVARVEYSQSPVQLQRADRRHTVNVTADADDRIVSAQKLNAFIEREVIPEIIAANPDVSFGAGGQSREQAEFMQSLVRLFVVAMVAAYAVLAIPLGSYLLPFLILLMVPFGFVGAVVGHALLGLSLSGFSLVGMMALSGVVVNDAVVLSHAWGRARSDGLQTVEALKRAAMGRVRPILLTSMTTSLGLLPMLMEQSAQAAWLKPMAVTLAFGVMCATVVTLAVLPALYLCVEDARRFRFRQRSPGGAHG